MLNTNAPLVRFGVFEVNLQSGELRKAGRRIALQEQPFRVLVRLLERPGQVVTREELRADLWPADTFVDFEQGLNGAVKRLREALGDSAESPRYIETLARRGYRFVAPLGSTISPPADSAFIHVRVRSAVLLLLLGLAAIAAAVVLGFRMVVAPPPRAQHQIQHLLLDMRPAEDLAASTDLHGRPTRTAFAISADGHLLVFSGRKGNDRQLYVRALDRDEAEPIADTKGGESPFLSPDARWVGFWADGGLRKVPIGGGTSVELCRAAAPFGASWGEGDTILFSPEEDQPLWRVAADGGTPQPVTRLDSSRGEYSHRLPFVLPGGKAALFTVQRSVTNIADSEVWVRSLATGEQRMLVADATDARYIPTGHVVFVRRGSLMVIPFDLVRLQVTGGPVGVILDVMQAFGSGYSSAETGAGQFTIASSGTLVYLTGGGFVQSDRMLVWRARDGKSQEALPIEPRPYLGPQISPDGSRLIVFTQTTPRRLWIHDIARGTTIPLALSGDAYWPTWTPDGKRLTFGLHRPGKPLEIAWVAADGEGDPERLVPDAFAPSSWAPDGRSLVFRSTQTYAPSVWQLTREANGWNARPLLPRGTAPVVSPDGRLLAYDSDETGRDEVYVVPYGRRGVKQQVSTGGGKSPLWAPDGRELFYSSAIRTGNRFFAVAVRSGEEPLFGKPHVLFEGTWAPGTGARSYDITPDGKRFLFVEPKQSEVAGGTPPHEMHVVLNWFEELKAKVPANK